MSWWLGGMAQLSIYSVLFRAQCSFCCAAQLLPHLTLQKKNHLSCFDAMCSQWLLVNIANVLGIFAAANETELYLLINKCLCIILDDEPLVLLTFQLEQCIYVYSRNHYRQDSSYSCVFTDSDPRILISFIPIFGVTALNKPAVNKPVSLVGLCSLT